MSFLVHRGSVGASMIRVVEFDSTAFENFATRAALGNLPGSVLVIGVANGGLPLARKVHELLRADVGRESVYAEITCQRPSTGVKKKSPFRTATIRAVFRILPTPVLDRLRALEHARLAQRRQGHLEREVHFSGSVRPDAFDWVLIVDDAVDSGSSLHHIRHYLTHEQGIPAAKLRVLVAAVTQDAPLVEPDYAWTRGVLVRFPWSLDAH